MTSTDTQKSTSNHVKFKNATPEDHTLVKKQTPKDVERGSSKDRSGRGGD